MFHLELLPGFAFFRPHSGCCPSKQRNFIPFHGRPDCGVPRLAPHLHRLRQRSGHHLRAPGPRLPIRQSPNAIAPPTAAHAALIGHFALRLLGTGLFSLNPADPSSSWHTFPSPACMSGHTLGRQFLVTPNQPGTLPHCGTISFRC